MALSENVDSTYTDKASDPSVKQHQQDHDNLHKAYNAAVDAGEYDEGSETWNGASLDVIAEEVLASAAASITFSSIPADYRHLRVAFLGQRSANANVTLRLQFNGDSGANYDWQRLVAVSTTVSSSDSSGDTAITIGAIDSLGPSTLELLVPNYADTTFNGAVSAVAGNIAASPNLRMAYGEWNNTAAITSLTLSLSSGNFATGTMATLYGLKGA